MTISALEAQTEAARLEALVGYRILDTPPEQAFDDLVALAAAVCETSVAAIAFVDGHRAWLKAKCGTEVSEFPRDTALAAASHGLHFFAGAPLVSPDGHRLGTVCVLGEEPRELSSTQADALRAIARQVMSQLELRRISQAESSAAHKFRGLVERLPGAVYIEDLDASSGSYFSPQVEQLTGYSAEAWASEDDFFSQVLHPEDRDRVLGAFASAHASYKPVQIEYRVIAKDGRVVWIQDDAAVTRDDNGQPLYFQGLMMDITERHAFAAEREVLLARERAQNEQLRSLDVMKDEFVALVSHELRTPLTSIRGYVELVLDDDELLSSEHRAFLEIVDRNSDRLLHLVSDLLLLAQADAGKLSFDWTFVELVPLVAGCVRAARPAAERAGVELVFSSEPLAPICGDPVRLAQLLDNLISNAIKFTPTGGSVEVVVDASSASAVIEVRDTGVGIAAGDQEKLFERFFRTQSASDMAIAGTGLGLSIAKAIVDAHSGSIIVESTEDHGTTFRVELPAEWGGNYSVSVDTRTA